MSETEEQDTPEQEPTPESSGTRRPPGPPRRIGAETPDNAFGPLRKVTVTRRGKGIITLEALPKEKDQDGGQQPDPCD